MTLARAARSSFLLLVVLLVAGLFVACGSDEPAPDASKTAAKAPPKPAMKPKAQQKKLPEPSVAEALRARVKLPDYYPKDAPVYDGATTNSVGWQSGRVSAVFTTGDGPDEVSSELQDSLRDNGWEDIVEAEMVNGVVVQAAKDERGISALISLMEKGPSDEVTMIMVAVDP
jgi:hypothetical protein